MRTLLPSTDAGAPAGGEPTDIHQHYATDWLAEGGVRMNFIASIDGGASSAGKSRGLQTPGDNAVFAALRDLADVILVGASTARIEHYRPVRPAAERRSARAALGLAEVPAIAVMSASLELDLDAELFAAVDREAPTLIITGSSAPLTRRNDIIDLAATDTKLVLLETPSPAGGGVDFAAAVRDLKALGYRRILCEGGPRLFAAAILARSVDELCLTVSPMLAGPSGPRIIDGRQWPEDLLPQLRLTGLLLEDDALFCRYLVQR
ncbi:dihydrofolate reductase family protein [Jatrophihabitans sp. DSM 45814]